MTQIRTLDFLVQPAAMPSLQRHSSSRSLRATQIREAWLDNEHQPSESTAPPFPCSQASNHTHPQKSNQGAIQPSLPLPSVLPAYGPA